MYSNYSFECEKSLSSIESQTEFNAKSKAKWWMLSRRTCHSSWTLVWAILTYCILTFSVPCSQQKWCQWITLFRLHHFLFPVPQGDKFQNGRLIYGHLLWKSSSINTFIGWEFVMQFETLILLSLSMFISYAMSWREKVKQSRMWLESRIT